MNTSSSQEILKAAPAARRNAILSGIVAVIFGILFLTWFMPLFLEYLDTLPTNESIRIAISSIALLSVIPLSIGLFFLKQGLKILKAESFPPPGTKVLRDTPIIKGEKARWRGKVLIVVLIIILVCGVFNATVVP
jgi:hypothetical protein